MQRCAPPNRRGVARPHLLQSHPEPRRVAPGSGPRIVSTQVVVSTVLALLQGWPLDQQPMFSRVEMDAFAGLGTWYSAAGWYPCCSSRWQ